MYRKYHNSLFNIQYLYCSKKYDALIHRCIVAGLNTMNFKTLLLRLLGIQYSQKQTISQDWKIHGLHWYKCESKRRTTVHTVAPDYINVPCCCQFGVFTSASKEIESISCQPRQCQHLGIESFPVGPEVYWNLQDTDIMHTAMNRT